MEMKIYVVDDDSANLMVAEHILSQNGIAVTTLGSGSALLEKISRESVPDLILLDIKMPGMDGFETLDHLRKKEKELGINEIPVIFLTADETADTEKHGFEAGVSDYIRKPFDPDILLRRVFNIISKEKRLSSLRTEADTDKLTGFLNKSAASRIISRQCRSDLGCLMMIDLDSFKLVNDLYGHKSGDDILISFAAILRATLPGSSKLGRIGGDEFIAFVPDMQSEEAVAAAAVEMNRALVEKAKELLGEDMDIPLGASVGAVLVPQHGDDYDELLPLADKALYSVKKNGKHGYAFHQSGSGDDDAQDSSYTISRLSEILGERSIPNVALQLEKEAFSYVYRYIIRYIVRNQCCIYKVLFTLNAKEGVDERTHKESCDEFGELLTESLRKSDILMRSRFNQYFVLLTDIKKGDIDIVIGNIMHRWERHGDNKLLITHEAEFVSDTHDTHHKKADLHITVAGSDEADLRQTGTVLSQAGFRVSAMKSCKALLKYLSENKTDLILLSANLSDMNGSDAMKQLHNTASASSVPLVFVIPECDEAPETVTAALKLGAEDVIRKPCPPELLVHRIRRITEYGEMRSHCRNSGNKGENI